ncbi:MAG: CarD family transcriptional regulator [Vulcanimicrobiota bacterium]
MPPCLPSYEVGSLVFEPFLGLCTVINWMEETVLGVHQSFYELQPGQGNARVKVPASQMPSRGIRTLMSAEQLETILTTTPSANASDDGEIPRQHRWTRLVRSEQRLGAYEFLQEWRNLESSGANFNSKESEMREKIQKTVVQEIARVFQISLGKASLRLSRWLEPAKALREGKRKHV